MGCMSPNDLHVCVDLPLCIDCLQFSYLPWLKLNVHVFAALSHAILLMVCHHFIFNHLSYHGVKAHLPAQARYCPIVSSYVYRLSPACCTNAWVQDVTRRTLVLVLWEDSCIQ